MKKNSKPTTSLGKYGRNVSTYENMAIDMREYAMRPTSYHIAPFYLTRQIDKTEFYRMCEASESCKKALDFAREQCGINRFNKCVDNNLGMNSVLAYPMAQYLDDYKNESHYRSELTKKENSVIGKAIIEYDSILANKKDKE